MLRSISKQSGGSVESVLKNMNISHYRIQGAAKSILLTISGNIFPID